MYPPVASAISYGIHSISGRLRPKTVLPELNVINNCLFKYTNLALHSKVNNFWQIQNPTISLYTVTYRIITWWQI